MSDPVTASSAIRNFLFQSIESSDAQIAELASAHCAFPVSAPAVAAERASLRAAWRDVRPHTPEQVRLSSIKRAWINRIYVAHRAAGLPLPSNAKMRAMSADLFGVGIGSKVLVDTRREFTSGKVPSLRHEKRARRKGPPVDPASPPRKAPSPPSAAKPPTPPKIPTAKPPTPPKNPTAKRPPRKDPDMLATLRADVQRSWEQFPVALKDSIRKFFLDFDQDRGAKCPAAVREGLRQFAKHRPRAFVLVALLATKGTPILQDTVAQAYKQVAGVSMDATLVRDMVAHMKVELRKASDVPRTATPDAPKGEAPTPTPAARKGLTPEQVSVAFALLDVLLDRGPVTLERSGSGYAIVDAKSGLKVSIERT